MIAHITMQMHAANYLGERRRLGFDLRAIGYSVSSFARHVDTLNLQGPLTIEEIKGGFNSEVQLL